MRHRGASGTNIMNWETLKLTTAVLSGCLAGIAAQKALETPEKPGDETDQVQKNGPSVLPPANPDNMAKPVRELYSADVLYNCVVELIVTDESFRVPLRHAIPDREPHCAGWKR